MAYLDWEEDKNKHLKLERGISFEDVQVAIDSRKLLDSYPHPNKQRYPNQRIMVLEISGYVYLVPYIKEGQKIFLKTIIPSRKATKKYLNGK